MGRWCCIENCGACCQLDPSQRPELEEYLNPTQLEHYLSLVGPDGWCINFDQISRQCKIYTDRPDFCRVQADTFETMFGIMPADLNDFAIDCCEQQIEGVYGIRSLELLRFQQQVAE
ncbi:MAG: YkgJ family cysteine cluster protein [Cyanobacteria bacterium P01_H01_bin.121]